MNDADPLAERNARAHQYLQEGRDDLAIPLFEEVLAERVRVLGADHPDTIASRGNLAGAYESAWCLGKAISQYKKVLAHQLRVLGADHPSTLASRRNLEAARRARESGSASAPGVAEA